MTARVADMHDEAAVRLLHAAAWREYEAGSEMPAWDTPGKAEDTLEPFLEAGQIVVAEKDGEVVGMVSVGLWSDWWMLLNLIVDEKHRGNGIAKSLVAKAHEVAKERGAKHGYIWAPNRLTRFYEETGYAPVGRIMVSRAT